MYDLEGVSRTAIPSSPFVHSMLTQALTSLTVTTFYPPAAGMLFVSHRGLGIVGRGTFRCLEDNLCPQLRLLSEHGTLLHMHLQSILLGGTLPEGALVWNSLYTLNYALYAAMSRHVAF